MDLLSSLGNLAGQVKNITLPGIVAAFAFALLIWPPDTADRIPFVADHQPNFNQLRIDAAVIQRDNAVTQDAYLATSHEACTVKEGVASPLFLQNSGIQNRTEAAFLNQLTLDDTDRLLLKCAEEEQSLQNIEDLITGYLNTAITAKIADRDNLKTTYLKYVASLSPLAGTFKREVDDKDREIAKFQAYVAKFQHIKAERARRVNQYQRLDAEIKLRLGDAGRLRPKQKFDDILSGLGNHIVGFLTLVFGWALLIDPFNRAIFGAIYDSSFDDLWDTVRPRRKSAGQQVTDAWKPDPAKQPGMRSNALLCGLVVAVLLILAFVLALILPSTPSTSLTASVASVCSPSDICNGQKASAEPSFARVPSMTRTVANCSVIGSIGILVAWFLPAVLRGKVRKHGKYSAEPTHLQQQAFLKATESAPTVAPAADATPVDASTSDNPKVPPLSCDQKLARDWDRLSQPEYAIGMGLMLRTDYETLYTDYYGQSLVSSGMILPFFFLVVAIFLTPQFGLANYGLYLFLLAGELLFFLTAVDRRHKFVTEYETLISSAYLKRCSDAPKAAAPPSPTKTIADQISAALTNATIVENKDLHIKPGDLEGSTQGQN